MQRAARVREQYGGEAEYTRDFNLGKKHDSPGRTTPHDLIAEIRALSAREDAIRQRREGLIAALQESLGSQRKGGADV